MSREMDWWVQERMNCRPIATVRPAWLAAGKKKEGEAMKWETAFFFALTD